MRIDPDSSPKIQVVVALALLLVAAPLQAQAPAGTEARKWEYRLTPYLWTAGLDGTLGAGGRTADVDLSFSDIIEDLDFAAMLTFEARRGPRVFLLDTTYTDTSDDAETPGPLFSGGDFTSKQLMVDLEVGQRVSQSPKLSVDALVGLRYWNVKNELDLEAGTAPAVEVRSSKSWLDPVLGALARASLSPKWNASLKFDIGGFGIASDFTWQFFAGFNYALSQKGSLVFGYRYLDVDYDDDGFVYDVATHGPLLGYQFKF
jgi:hypothetical protein